MIDQNKGVEALWIGLIQNNENHEAKRHAEKNVEGVGLGVVEGQQKYEGSLVQHVER